MLRIILVLAAVASLLGGAGAWLMAFGAGMSDNPSEGGPGLIWLYGLPALAIALFIAAWWIGA